MPRKMGLTLKLAGSFGLAATLALVVMGVFGMEMAKRNLVEALTETSEREVKQRARELEAWIQRGRSSLQLFEQTPAIMAAVRASFNQGADPLSGATYRQSVNQVDQTALGITKVTDGLVETGIIDSENDDVSRALVGRDGNPYVQDIEDSREGVDEAFTASISTSPGHLVSEPIAVARDDGRVDTILRVAAPIRSGSGAFWGHAHMTFDLGAALAGLPRAEKSAFRYFLFDGTGRSIRGPEAAQDLQPRDLQPGSGEAGTAPADPAASQESISKVGPSTGATIFGKLFENFLEEGNLFALDEGGYVAVERVQWDVAGKQPPWILVKQIPASVVTAAITPLSRWFAVAGGITFLIVLVCGTLFARSLAKPFAQILGDLDVTAETNLKSCEDLAKSSHNVSSACSEQAAAIHEVVSSTTEMNSMIVRTLEQIQDASRSAQEAGAKSDQGRDVMENLAKMMETLGTSSATVERSVREMAEFSNARLTDISHVMEEVASKTGVIHEIVRETKLLSFNASIEAARAGQHGRGFAVVAQEVGNLASMSGKAAEEINQLLLNSRKKVEAIVSDTQSKVTASMDLVKEGAGIVSQAQRTGSSAGAIFANIAGEVDSISGQFEAVKSAAEEQKIGLDQISQSMREMNATTSSTNDAASNNVQQVESIRHSAATLGRVRATLASVVVGRERAEGFRRPPPGDPTIRQSSPREPSNEVAKQKPPGDMSRVLQMADEVRLGNQESPAEERPDRDDVA